MNVLKFEDLPNLVTMLAKEVSQLKDLLIKNQEREPVDNSGQLLSIDEVAELLHLTKPTIYSKHSKGELPGVCKRGKRLYFQRDVIIDWIKSGRTKSNAEIETATDEYLSNNKKGQSNEK
ncbi:MAG: helix-turn-helix domain-containing protein [Flavobacteriales bacterium]|nr:helix-turn-helix domain-containing protein [Flavobacteriales bacterium]